MIRSYLKISCFTICSLVLFCASTCEDEDPIVIEEDLVFSLSRIDEPTTWTNRVDGVDYIVENNVSVFSDLIIEPGTSIAFLEDAGLEIEFNGVLKAEGSGSSPIIFSGEEKTKGAWRGLLLNSEKKSVLEHCVVEYAGAKRDGKYKDCAVYVTGTAAISHSTIQYSAYNGIGLAVNGVSEADIQTFEDNEFIENDGFPIYAPARLISQMDLPSCIYEKNDQQKLAVYINNSNRDLVGAHTWENPSIPYLMTSSINPKENWSIEEGTQILMEEGTKIHVRINGSMKINGSVDAPVLIKSNQNLPGSWKGIFIENDSQNKFNHLEIYHGGSSPYIDNIPAGNITIGSFPGFPVKLELSNCLMAESAACGVSVQDKNNVDFVETNSSYSGNTDGNMCLN